MIALPEKRVVTEDEVSRMNIDMNRRTDEWKQRVWRIQAVSMPWVDGEEKRGHYPAVLRLGDGLVPKVMQVHLDDATYVREDHMYWVFAEFAFSRTMRNEVVIKDVPLEVVVEGTRIRATLDLSPYIGHPDDERNMRTGTVNLRFYRSDTDRRPESPDFNRFWDVVFHPGTDYPRPVCVDALGGRLDIERVRDADGNYTARFLSNWYGGDVPETVGLYGFAGTANAPIVVWGDVTRSELASLDLGSRIEQAVGTDMYVYGYTYGEPGKKSFMSHTLVLRIERGTSVSLMDRMFRWLRRMMRSRD